MEWWGQKLDLSGLRNKCETGSGDSTCGHILLIILDIVLFLGVAAFICGLKTCKNDHSNSELHIM